jgi:hypothetical protein
MASVAGAQAIEMAIGAAPSFLVDYTSVPTRSEAGHSASRFAFYRLSRTIAGSLTIP